MFVCMKRSLLLLFAALALACTSGCGKKSEATDQSSTSASDTAQAQASGDTAATTAPEPPGPQPVPIPEPTASDTQAGDSGATGPVDTSALTIQLRRWMMNTRSAVPKTFEDWIAKSKIQVPPPPPGKKYVIRSGWVALVDK
jgi:hypothetical protein